MENHNIKLQMTDRYTLSLAQGDATSFVTDYAEVAMWDEKQKSFVSPYEWCMSFVGDEYEHDVIGGVDAYELADILLLAKQWVMTKGDEYVL